MLFSTLIILKLLQGNQGASGLYWFEQKLDHFCQPGESHCDRTFAQRYWINDTFYEEGGPHFLCIGGEGPALDVGGNPVIRSVHCNRMVEMAPKFHAKLIAFEHRYYGESIPVPDFSLPNLQWGSSRQALEDLATFVRWYSNSTNFQGKWIAFGGSYPGMLAAWFRMKYPDLIFGSIASSAPVQAQLNFRGYHDVLGKSYLSPIVGGSDMCFKTIRDGHAEIARLLKESAGRALLLEKFNFCKGMSLEDEFSRQIWSGFGVIRLNEMNDPDCSEPNCNIRKICGSMVNQTLSPMDSLALISRQQLNGNCISEYYYEFPKVHISNVDPKAEHAYLRPWFYQLFCTQFGFFKSCEPGSQCPYAQILGANYWLDVCLKIFSVSKSKVVKHIQQTNLYFGDNHPDVTRVLWVNGNVDPWYNLSVIPKEASWNSEIQQVDGQDVLLVNGVSHHFWTHPSKSSDSIQLQKARQQIELYVEKLLTI